MRRAFRGSECVLRLPVPTDRVVLSKYVEQAKRHVVETEKHLQQRRVALVDLERKGHMKAAERARKALSRFEALQAEFIADHNRLKKELADLH